MIYITLFWEFFKTGLFAVGGGLATLPFLYEISDKYGWYSYDDLANLIAVSESTPGPIGVNMSTYAGFTVSGVFGALTSTFGLVFPSVVIIIFISKVLNKFKDNFYVQSAFYGLRPASTGLIAAAGWGIIQISLFYFDKWDLGFEQIFNYKAIILAAVLLFLVRKFKKHPVFYIAGAAAAGVVFNF